MAGRVVHGNVTGEVDEAAVEALRGVEEARGKLLGELVGLGTTMCAAMDAHAGFVPCEHAFGVVIEGVAAVAACEDALRLEELAAAVRARSEHVAEHRGVPQGAVVAPRVDSDGAMALSCLLGAAPRMARLMGVGIMSQRANVALVRALAALGDKGGDACAPARELVAAAWELSL